MKKLDASIAAAYGGLHGTAPSISASSDSGPSRAAVVEAEHQQTDDELDEMMEEAGVPKGDSKSHKKVETNPKATPLVPNSEDEQSE